jgi:1-phosphofructokinase
VIVTVTLNPSLDRTIEVDRLVRGTMVRAGAARLDPGGKGVNVSRALAGNGVESCAVLPCGGGTGERVLGLLEAERVNTHAVRIAQATRSNLSLVEADGTVTKLNEPGAALSRDELDAVQAAVVEAAQSADWVVICGSLPPEAPVDTYAELCRRCAAAGVRVALDTSGPALLAALAAHPTLVKPNRDELEEAVGAPVNSLPETIAAAEGLIAWGAGSVLASLGPDGAVLVTRDGAIVGAAHVDEVRSTVGAGDALLAGFLSVGTLGAAALAEGLAWGAAAVRLPGSRMPGPDDIDRTNVTTRSIEPHGWADEAAALIDHTAERVRAN